MTAARKRLTFMTALWLGLPAAGAVAAEPDYRTGPGTARDEECLVCHSGTGEPEAPKLDVGVYLRTVHAVQGCIGCHPDVEDGSIQHEEPDEDLSPVNCGACHEAAAREYVNSIHETRHRFVTAANEEPATCVRCHGAHDIRKTEHPLSRVNRVQQARTCGRCHGQQRRAAGHPLATLPSTAPFEATRAPKGTTSSTAAVVAASCTDCHGAHRVQTTTHADSLLHPRQVVRTCGACHEEQVVDFTGSAHDRAAQREGFDWIRALAQQAAPDDHAAERSGHNGHAAPPVCITCHRMHTGSRPASPRFREDLVHECGTCHAALMQTYIESYHGKATLLGADSVAKCSDCHGYHGIRGPDDPRSRVSDQRKLQTCRSCHEGAPPKFAEFWAHADHNDRERYPVLYWVYTFMTTLLVSVLSFFGLHTLLWALREGIDAIRYRAEPRHIFKGPPIQRFSATDRILHFFVIISFLGLAATGAPLKFAEASWARAALGAFGGVQAAGWLHRVFAVITFGYFFAHLGQLAYHLLPELRRGRLLKALLGPDSLVPRWSDVTDVVRHFAWFLGPGEETHLGTLDLLGEVRLLGCLLGRCDHRIFGAHSLVPGVFRVLLTRLGSQRRARRSFGRSLVGHRLYLRRSLL